MKKNKIVLKTISLSILTTLLLLSCDPKSEETTACPQSYFIKEFPKRNINFEHVLGSSFALRANKDTLIYAVYFNKKNKVNTIVDTKTKDTLFHGKISRYKGLFFFSAQQADSTWHIQALKIKKGLIYGFNTMQQQMCWLDEIVSPDHIETEKRKLDLIMDPDSSYTLRPVKKTMKKIYARFVDSLQADTLLLLTKHTVDSERIHYEPSELIEDSEEETKVYYEIYPNPFKDQLTVFTSADRTHQLEIIDLNGEVIKKINALQKMNNLDLHELKPGTYIIRLTDSDYNTTISKIIKE